MKRITAIAIAAAAVLGCSYVGDASAVSCAVGIKNINIQRDLGVYDRLPDNAQMDKVMKVGADNCLIMNSREYLASEAEIEQNRAAYYLFPETKVVSRFIATQLDDKIYPQISYYFLKEQMDALEKLVRKQRIPQTIRNGAVHSYRYVIAGMLLNHPLCRALGASANND